MRINFQINPDSSLILYSKKNEPLVIYSSKKHKILHVIPNLEGYSYKSIKINNNFIGLRQDSDDKVNYNQRIYFLRENKLQLVYEQSYKYFRLSLVFCQQSYNILLYSKICQYRVVNFVTKKQLKCSFQDGMTQAIYFSYPYYIQRKSQSGCIVLWNLQRGTCIKAGVANIRQAQMNQDASQLCACKIDKVGCKIKAYVFTMKYEIIQTVLYFIPIFQKKISLCFGCIRSLDKLFYPNESFLYCLYGKQFMVKINLNPRQSAEELELDSNIIMRSLKLAIYEDIVAFISTDNHLVLYNFQTKESKYIF